MMRFWGALTAVYFVVFWVLVAWTDSHDTGDGSAAFAIGYVIGIVIMGAVFAGIAVGVRAALREAAR